MKQQIITQLNVSESFIKASQKKDGKKKTTSPISIRFTVQEREYLSQLAGQQPVSTYIRETVLGDQAQKRKVHHQPKMEDTQYASLLVALGQSRLSSNLNQLAKHANMGTIDCSDNLEQQLEEAYEAILAMRDALLVALGCRSVRIKQ